MSTTAPPGWYPDPERPGEQRWWDGTQWTPYRSASPLTPAAAFGTSEEVATGDRRNWALAAHLSTLPAMIFAMAFLGPLLVYLVKRDDPFVRRHAAEALNFQLSVLIYALAFAVVLVITLALVVGVVLVPVGVAFAVAWLVLIIRGASAAGRGEPYRYPLTIRFVR